MNFSLTWGKMKYGKISLIYCSSSIWWMVHLKYLFLLLNMISVESLWCRVNRNSTAWILTWGTTWKDGLRRLPTNLGKLSTFWKNWFTEKLNVYSSLVAKIVTSPCHCSITIAIIWANVKCKQQDTSYWHLIHVTFFIWKKNKLKIHVADYLLGNPGKVRATASMMQTDLYIFLRPKVKHRFIPGNIEFNNTYLWKLDGITLYLQRPKWYCWKHL